MDIQIGIAGSETTFEYAIIDYNYQVSGTTHTTASGTKRVQYASENKYLFRIRLTFVKDNVWNDLLSELRNSKLSDLNLIVREDTYIIRFLPETLTKIPIRGTAQGYDIAFGLIEV